MYQKIEIEIKLILAYRFETEIKLVFKRKREISSFFGCVFVEPAAKQSGVEYLEF